MSVKDSRRLRGVHWEGMSLADLRLWAHLWHPSNREEKVAQSALILSPQHLFQVSKHYNCYIIYFKKKKKKLSGGDACL